MLWPKLVLRDFIELQVSIKSPNPERPKKVSSFAPIFLPNLRISAKLLEYTHF